jgi:uncharacterized cupredoxin-like copper-binding protein
MRGMVLLIAFAMLVAAASPAAEAPTHVVTVLLKDFKFEPAVLQLNVGDAMTLTIRNEGRVAHEWLIGRGIVRTADEKGFQKDLFAVLNPKVDGRQYSLEQVGRRPPGRDESATRSSMGVEIQPGGEVTLRFTVPESAKGEWEMGCFFSGHFESGMKGTLVIE